ncbi:MAG: ABC transporter ATP-binding protein [Desulfobacula sp.]|jgi:branched-chain amino acid transport system ATP-binding protein|uniref:ABC transporter ATP-binding protein n=1 Tax=Desulfobacula sp. TaxID=2593537 RepID=UPI001D254E64|nr:ABC transporter ATP-binding protein [Desulfobacula sp.]MBT4024269.1 ABC transporter ATP-binding protein [Desulfobacula sp.]MBT4874685.1 ABC transporter ATP-binding protein [Desulfobacula sp.]MBT5543442.1 ABC transporter ATP-binding protein [Desulfobacula sp.]MBT5973015.1 ABC transporter ATP-binding protein [Desulfobacula sp.]
MLHVTDIETFYGQSQILFGIDISVDAGEVVTVMGRNGMGKTTLLRSIIGLTPPRSGSIRFNDKDLTGQPSYVAARSGIALVPEGRQVFPTLTVRENLICTAANRLGAADAWTLEKVYELFPKLAERSNALGCHLSGGEQQMLAIGRALMTNGKLLMLDDATEGLAPMICEEIWCCVDKIKATGQAIMIVDRDIETMIRIADRHYIMEKGRFVWTGNSDTLAAEPEIWQHYLGV